jgi:WD40 repeat protein
MEQDSNKESGQEPGVSSQVPTQPNESESQKAHPHASGDTIQTGGGAYVAGSVTSEGAFTMLGGTIKGDVHIDYHGHAPLLTTGPTSYLPFLRNTLFQPRPGEFDHLETLLLRSNAAQQPVRVGLVGVTGMGGIGKTQLAVEFAYRYQDRFPGGIFWMPATGRTFFDWQRQFAELALNANYLPADDDVSNPENEVRRARHFCRYLAGHTDSLLILDNVEDPTLVLSVLPGLAGKEPACAIIYTSRSTLTPPGIIPHSVGLLPEDAALRLLLETTRPKLLTEAIANLQNEETDAARFICQETGYLPLALVHLRGLLARDQRITLVRLAEVLKQRGALDVAKTQQGDAFPLFETFRLSWEKVSDEGTRRLFKLASYFPEATAIPLWLLGLAAGLGERAGIFEPLWEARLQLQELSLIEEFSEDQVQLHPLVRAFGQRLLTEEGDKGKVLLEEAGARLVSEFENLNQLERRAQREGYWGCLKQVRTTRKYTEALGVDNREWLVLLERWMDREGELPGNARLWPNLIPGLFYQQFYNRSVEEGYAFSGVGEAPMRWLRQIEKAGAEDQSQLKIFTSYPGRILGVAFSPDGSKIFAGSEDGTIQSRETETGNVLTEFHIFQENQPEGIDEIYYLILSEVVFSFDGTRVLTRYRRGIGQTARLWETESGKLLAVLSEHRGDVESIAFSADGKQVFSGSDDKTAQLSEIPSGKLLVTFKGHGGGVMSVAFSPNGRQVLSGSSDKTVRLWEMIGKDKRKKEPELFSRLSDEVTSMLFSPNGSRLLTSSSNRRTVRLWETESGKPLVALSGDRGSVISMAFSPDGTRVLTGSDDRAKTARLWETESGKLLVMLPDHRDSVKIVAFSSDGTRLLTGTNSETRVWETASGKPLGGGYFPSELRIRSMLFSPDGTRVLTGHDHGTARLWETASGKLLAELEAHGWYDVTGVAFSPDGTKIFTGTYSTAWVWETASGKMLAQLQAYTTDNSGLYGDYDIATMEIAAFSPDGTRLLTGSTDGTVRLWGVESGMLLAELWSPFFSKWQTHTGYTVEIEHVTFSPDGRLAISCSQDGQVLFWQVSKAEVSRRGFHLEPSSGETGKDLGIQSDDPKIAEKRSRLLGVYVTSYSVGAVHWQNSTHVLLADKGGSRFRPHFYRLKLEGAW